MSKKAKTGCAASLAPSLAGFMRDAGIAGVDRKSWVKLPHQVADALRRAIGEGVWAPGEQLPSARQLASGFGVSFRVALSALRILAKENRIALRAKSRAAVKVEESMLKNHRVLLVLPGGIHEYANMTIYERIRMHLNAAGYMVTVTSLLRVGSRNRYDVAQLRADLRRQYEIVICPRTTNRQVLDMIKTSGQPFIIMPGKAVAAQDFVGNICCDTGSSDGAFVGHCRRRKVRSVTIVGKWRGDGSRIQEALAAEGIDVGVMVVPAKVCIHRGESIERAVFDAFSRRLLRDGKGWLPEVLYFTDDFACYGAMTAMLTHGVSVPEDVRVATVANRGSLRAFKMTLTRIEYDLSAMGDAASDFVLKFLRSGEFPADAVVRPAFRVGGSFR